MQGDGRVRDRDTGGGGWRKEKEFPKRRAVSFVPFRGAFLEYSLGCDPCLDIFDRDLFLFVLCRSVQGVRSSQCIESGVGDEIALEDHDLAALALVVKHRGTVMEGTGCSRLVLCDRDESRRFRGGS